jgi:hypothetical protein
MPYGGLSWFAPRIICTYIMQTDHFNFLFIFIFTDNPLDGPELKDNLTRGCIDFVV